MWLLVGAVCEGAVDVGMYRLMDEMLDLSFEMLIAPKVLMVDYLHCWDEMIAGMMDTRTSMGLPVGNDECATQHQRMQKGLFCWA